MEFDEGWATADDRASSVIYRNILGKVGRAWMEFDEGWATADGRASPVICRNILGKVGRAWMEFDEGWATVSGRASPVIFQNILRKVDWAWMEFGEVWARHFGCHLNTLDLFGPKSTRLLYNTIRCDKYCAANKPIYTAHIIPRTPWFRQTDRCVLNWSTDTPPFVFCWWSGYLGDLSKYFGESWSGLDEVWWRLSNGWWSG